MLKKLLIFVAFALITALVWYLNTLLSEMNFDKVFYSCLSISLSYLLLKVFLEGLISKKVKDTRARYSLRKTSQILFVVVLFIVLLRVWIPDPQALLVAYGLVAAGVAIALQDVFKNFAGALAILLAGVYRVGDRIEIDSKYGDVIDIGLFYTSLIELRAWVDGDQTTGRISMLPNGLVLNNHVHNYTKDHSFIWEELSLPVTYESNWKKAIEIIRTVVETKTSETTKSVEREISHLEEKYFLSKRNIEPTVFVTPTDNWILLQVRYVVNVRDRRLVSNELLEIILKKIQETPDITIASQSLSISTSPIQAS